MLYRFLLIPILYILSCVCSSAQLPTDFRSEQIFLGVANTEVAMNDTIEANGVVTCLSNVCARPYSRYLYLELLNSSDSVIVRQKVACNEDGNFHAAIPTAAVYDEGLYYLRAYTKLMCNFSGESFASQPLLIGKKIPGKHDKFFNNIRCLVYPEGGFLVDNQIQGLVVVLTDGNGESLGGARVQLVSDRGDTICDGRTHLSGVLEFKFIPQAGVKYQLLASKDDMLRTFDVAVENRNSMKLQCAISGGKLKYKILNARNDLSPYKLYIYDRVNGLLHIDNVMPSGIIPLAKESLLSTVFLTDSIGDVVTEATALAKYRMAEMPQIPDTITCGVATEMNGKTDSLNNGRVLTRFVAEYEPWVQSAESELLYTADFMSPMCFPDNLFKESGNDRAADLQAWLGTAKFSRFNIKDAMAKDTAMYVYMPEETMTIEGNVETENHTVFRGGTLVVYNTLNNCVYDGSIGKDGHFRIGVDDFDCGTTFFLQAINKHGKIVGSYINMADERYPAPVIYRRYKIETSKYASSEVVVTGEMKGRVLPDVVVKAQVREDPPLPSNKFYENNYADREKIEKHNYKTLADILRGFSFLSVTYENGTDGMTWLITTNRGKAASGSTYIPILLDGTRVDTDLYDVVLNMFAFDIEEVEFLQPWQALAYTWGALRGAIKVTTRGVNKSGKVRSKGTFYTPMGLSVATGKPKRKVAPGRYRLLVDVISPEGVTSYERGIVVTQ